MWFCRPCTLPMMVVGGAVCPITTRLLKRRRWTLQTNDLAPERWRRGGVVRAFAWLNVLWIIFGIRDGVAWFIAANIMVMVLSFPGEGGIQYGAIRSHLARRQSRALNISY